MMTDTVSDCLSRLRNAQMAKLSYVNITFSKVNESVLFILRDEGFVDDYKVIENGAKKNIYVTLKYYKGLPVIQELRRISKPGKRVYTSLDSLKSNKFYSGLGILVISTSKGIMTDHSARKSNCGGEVLCAVF